MCNCALVQLGLVNIEPHFHTYGLIRCAGNVRSLEKLLCFEINAAELSANIP